MKTVSVALQTVPTRRYVLFLSEGNLYWVAGPAQGVRKEWRAAYSIGDSRGEYSPRAILGPWLCMRVESSDPDTGDIHLRLYSEEEQGEIIPALIQWEISEWEWK